MPWLRQGVANTIVTQDRDPSVKTRASVHVALQLSGDPVGGGTELVQPLAQDIALYGPGDIIGIDTRAIFRTDPLPWITNYEFELSRRDRILRRGFRLALHARGPGHERIAPASLVDPDRSAGIEFTEGAIGGPLPCITIPHAEVLPPADELWAWAHVHFSQSIAGSPTELVSPDMGAVLPRVQVAIAQNPDSAYGRLLCPRRLDDNTGYYAFVIPTFETGRLAGIGKDPSLAPNATYSAWGPAYAGRPDPTLMPIYYRWYFRTGSKGDFEYLISLLKPRPVDPQVGARDMDVQDPGSNIPGINDAQLGGVLKLGGALRVPDEDLTTAQLQERQKFENWDQPYPHPFQTALAAFVDLPDAYCGQLA